MKARLSSLPPWPIHTSLSIVRPRSGEDFTRLFPTHKAWSLQSVLASKPLACVLMSCLHNHDHLYSHLFNTQIIFLQPLVSTAAKAISSRSWLVRAPSFTEPLTTAVPICTTDVLFLLLKVCASLMLLLVGSSWVLVFAIPWDCFWWGCLSHGRPCTRLPVCVTSGPKSLSPLSQKHLQGLTR